jgi:hypothetical protein
MKIVNTKLKGVNVKELSGKQLMEFLEFSQSLGELTPSKNLKVACMLISMSACDKEGKLLYTPETAEELPFSEIQLLSDKVIALNKMGETKNLPNGKNSSTTD